MISNLTHTGDIRRKILQEIYLIPEGMTIYIIKKH